MDTPGPPSPPGPPYASSFLNRIWDGIAKHGGVVVRVGPDGKETAASPEEAAILTTGTSDGTDKNSDQETGGEHPQGWRLLEAQYEADEDLDYLPCGSSIFQRDVLTLPALKHAAETMKSIHSKAETLLKKVMAVKIPVPRTATFDVATAYAQLAAIEQQVERYEQMEVKNSEMINMVNNDTDTDDLKEVLQAHKNMRDRLLNAADGRKVRVQVTNTTNDQEICPVNYYELLASCLNDIKETEMDIAVQKEAGDVGKLLSKMAVDGSAQRRPTYKQVETKIAELRKLLA